MSQNELKRTEKRLSVLRLELAEAETGKSVAVDSTLLAADIYDTTRSSDFSRQLSGALKEVARSVSSLEDALAEKKPRPKAAARGSIMDTHREDASALSALSMGSNSSGDSFRYLDIIF